MSQSVTTTTETQIDTLRPRVALIGPKGSGKTIYREWLEVRGPDTWLTKLLRMPSVRGFDALTLVPGNGGYAYGSTVATGSTGRNPDELEFAAGTNDLTVLKIGMEGQKIHVLDFPGEWNRKQNEEGYDARNEGFDRKLLEQCKLIVFFAPFWSLLPERLRTSTNLVGDAMAERLLLGLDEEIQKVKEELREKKSVLSEAELRDMQANALIPLEGRRRALEQKPFSSRTNPMFEHGERWLAKLREVFSASRDKPSLLIVLSMLGRDWPYWLPVRQDAELSQVREKLARIRSVLTSVDMNAESTIGGADSTPGLFDRASTAGNGSRRRVWLSNWLAEFSRVRRGTRLLGQMRELDHRVGDFLELVRRLDAGTDRDPGSEFRNQFSQLIDLAAPVRVQHMAMNIVSERFRRRLNPGGKQFLRLEPAGAGLPAAHLLARIDALT